MAAPEDLSPDQPSLLPGTVWTGESGLAPNSLQGRQRKPSCFSGMKLRPKAKQKSWQLKQDCSLKINVRPKTPIKTLSFTEYQPPDYQLKPILGSHLLTKEAAFNAVSVGGLSDQRLEVKTLLLLLSNFIKAHSSSSVPNTNLSTRAFIVYSHQPHKPLQLREALAEGNALGHTALLFSPRLWHFRES